MNIKLGKRDIGGGAPPFVIAEAGINHNGDFSKALQLVDAAVAAGADCIKFQCHITEAEMIQTNEPLGKLSKERLWDIIKRCELTEDQEKKIKEYCEMKGIIYLCTPFSREAADRLQRLNVSGFKIGSGECNNYPLLDHIARFRKPMILSTGMNSMESIREAVETIKKHNCPLVLLHCTSIYPTPYEKVRLGILKELESTFKVPVGLSDHSLGVYTCLGAVSLGACVLEKHFTVSRSWPGPDISISIEPQELKDLAVGSRAIFAALGGSKSIFDEEKPVISFAYASVVSLKSIRKGEVFTSENIWVKRPGTGGIPARDLPKILGSKAARDLDKDKQLSKEDVSNAA